MKRRNSIGFSDNELESYLKVLTDSFGLKWLEEKSNHPLQLLWNRNDELSTNELISLAYAIKELSQIDSAWTKKQLQIIKGKDKNNCKGAIFEIIGLNMMHNQTEHPIKPAKVNQAGYDGLITRSDNTETRVSIKNYGISSSQKAFEKKAKSVETKILTLLKKYKYPPVQILLDFPDKYPDERDWKMLEERLDDIFKNQRNQEEPFTALVEPRNPALELSRENNRHIFIIIIYPFKFPKEEFHENFQSYTLMISAKYHENEHLNLFSKMNDACSNLLKHSANESETVTNTLLLHLPETISLDECVTWLDDYFEEFPEKQISYVFLYQATVATDLKTNYSGINHSCRIYVKKGRQLKGNFKFEIPIGIVSNKSTTPIYIAEHPDGKKETVPLENRYIFQHGEHYMKMVPDGKGGYKGNIRRLGSGVHVNLVVQLPGQKKTAVMKGKFPPTDELLIL